LKKLNYVITTDHFLQCGNNLFSSTVSVRKWLWINKQLYIVIKSQY